MKLIAAVDRRWAIGNRGNLLVSIPDDQRRFRQETLGKVVVMGRKTLQSLPGGQPLYGRTTIVLSRDPDFSVKGARTASSLDEALKLLEGYPSENIYIAGGQEIYQEFLPYCDTAYITWIDYEYDADAYFPNLEKTGEWEMAGQSEEQTYFNLCYEFRIYKRKPIVR